MGNKLYQESAIQDIAAAIREKNGGVEKYTVAQMGAAIRAISGSEPLAEYSQTNPIVARYMAEVAYPAGDYSESRVVPYIYEETAYEKGHPVGYEVVIEQAGELHLADAVAVVRAPSIVGANTLYNAIPGEVAHWWHTAADSVTRSGTIKPTGQVRMVKTTAKNVRDLGGWPCDGGVIKYGRLFRGGLLSEDDRAVLADQLHIRHDLDLRGKSDNGGLTASPLGSDIVYTCTESYVWYSLQREDEWRTILGTIFDAAAKNEPVVFHCAAGADRTGTVACVVEAILGVSQPNLDKDFELTSFSIFPNARRRTDDDWKGLMAEINAISVGATIRDKIINWVGYLGFTADQVNAFREAMIDGNPENIAIEEYTPTEPETNYFDASTAELNKRISSSGSASAYNGMVTSDFIPVDSSMSALKIHVSGVTVITSADYGYEGRVAWYNADKSYISAINFVNGALNAYGNVGGSFMRVSLVIKDNIAISSDDIANIKITLE